jgi:hypothetical protein
LIPAKLPPLSHLSGSGKVRLFGSVCALLVSAFGTGSSHGQEAIRASMTGSQAASARARAINEDYNLKVGPVRLNVRAALDAEFNDNIDLADEVEGAAEKQADIILRPRVELTGGWQITRLNRLDLRLGLGIEHYLTVPRTTGNTLVMAPSEISFDVFVGDVKLNFHDRFSLQQDSAATDPTLNNTTQQARFTNTIGVSALWDLNQAVVTAGYDHTDVVATTKQVNSEDRRTDLFYVSVALRPDEAMTTGVQSSIALTSYSDTLRPSLSAFSAGPFLYALITPYTRVELAGGGQFYLYDYAERPTSDPFLASLNEEEIEEPAEEGFGFYASLTVSNRLNANFTHSLALGHERQLASGADYVDLEFLRYSSAWKVNRKLTLSSGFFLERGKSGGGGSVDGEEFTRSGAAFSFSVKLTKKLDMALRYVYTSKESDILFRDYAQNVFGITFQYDF